MSPSVASRLPIRKNIRLPGYDYRTPGAYFVTICSWEHHALFGEIQDGEFRPNDFGQIVSSIWDGLPTHFSRLKLGPFVVMPNHIHAVVWLLPEEIEVDLGVPKHGLPLIVNSLKSFSTREINKMRNRPGGPVWQRGYYEHIIGTEEALNAISSYIEQNPAMWKEDPENPDWQRQGRGAAQPSPQRCSANHVGEESCGRTAQPTERP